MILIHDRCKKLWTKYSGLGGGKNYVHAWWKADDVNEEIDELEKRFNGSYQLLMVGRS